MSEYARGMSTGHGGLSSFSHLAWPLVIIIVATFFTSSASRDADDVVVVGSIARKLLHARW